MPEVWGRGLATDACRAFIEIGFGHYAFDELVATTLTTNAASENVMKKCGFTYDRTFVNQWGPHVLYRLARPSSPATANE
jgi:RimJ/RimL family protein N-acetyltransferase